MLSNILSEAVVEKEKRAPMDKLVEGLKIVPDASVLEAMKGMENLAPYIIEDEKFDGKGARVEHDGRMFLISTPEEFDKVASILKKYPAPTKEVIDVMKSGEVPENPYPDNFIVYFLENSGFNITIPSNRNASSMFVSTDASLAAASNVPFPGVYGYNAEDNLAYTLTFSQENVKKILSLSALPIIGFTSLNNSSLYQSLDARLFYIFFEIEHSDSIKKDFSGLLNEFRYDLKVLLIPNLNQHVKIEQYGLTEKDLPGCISIHDDGGKFVQRKVSAENMKEFVKNVLEQKAEIFYNSQDEPTDNADLNVKVITRNNVKLHLDDSTKDRLFVFGTSRCPHCIKIRPTLEILGSVAKTYANDKVTIGYCDVEENDMNDFDIRFVPTLLLYKAGSNESIVYDGGERNLENLMTFIRDNGGLSIDLSRLSVLEANKDEMLEEAEKKVEETVMPEVEKPEETRKAEL